MTRRATDLAFALLLGAMMFAFAMSSPNIAGGDDAYRHVRFAYRLATDTQAALADPWHLIYLWSRPVDVWFGYHLLLAPFTLFLPLIIAAKLVGSLVWAASVFALLRLFDRLEIAWRHAWVILAVAGGGITLYRAMLMRPFLLSLLLFVLAIRYTLEQRRWPLALVSALHAASYSIFFLPLMPVGLYLLVSRTKQTLLLCVACVTGLAVGLTMNPFFPENVRFAFAQAYTPGLTTGMAETLKIGGELLPLNPWWLVASVPALAMWITAILVLAFRWQTQRPSAVEWVLLAQSVFCLAVSFRVARMFDLFVPTSAILAAVVLSPYLLRFKDRAVYACALAFVLIAANLVPALTAAQSATSVERYRAASAFLEAQGPSTVVLNTQWQQYPFLYFWNWKSRYLTGLDPTFFYNWDKQRYWQWRTLADDAVPDGDTGSLETLVFGDFGATHIVVDRALTPKLGETLRSHVRLAEVFRDADLSVFALRKP